MTMKSELDETEIRAYEGTLSRDRDPVVPRGSVVAGKDRGLESGAGELEHVAVAWLRSGTDELVALAPIKGVESAPPSAEIYCAFLTYSAPAEERIRALEEELERVRLRNGDLLGEVTRMDRLWCSAIVATQGPRDGRMVCDVEELLRWFNEHKGSAPGLVPDHDCELALDLTPHFDDGRVLRVGRITRPPDGLPQEKWCLHVKTPFKPELAFCLNEPDLNYLVVVAYACLGYHTDPGWVEALAGGSEPHHYAAGRYPDQEKVERIRQLAKSEAELMGAIRDREELKARLEEVRPVVRAALHWWKALRKQDDPEAVRYAHARIERTVDALSPTTREWAEGEGEEET